MQNILAHRDRANRDAYVTNRAFAGSVSVVDSETNTVVKTIDVGFSPEGIAYDPKNTNIDVANGGPCTVSVIDSSTNAVLATISVGVGARGVAFGKADRHIYVANYGANTVSVISSRGLLGISILARAHTTPF